MFDFQITLSLKQLKYFVSKINWGHVTIGVELLMGYIQTLNEKVHPPTKRGLGS
jgi:hypothetical protein